MEKLHQNLEDYRRQLESSTDRRLEVSNYREMIGHREDEIRKQIDKIEVIKCDSRSMCVRTVCQDSRAQKIIIAFP